MSRDTFNPYDEELVEFFGDAVVTTKNNIKSIIDAPDEECTHKTCFIENGINICQGCGNIIDAPEEECVHEICFDTDGINICQSCGCQVELLDFQAEWRYYGASDNRSSRDPSRCHRSKESTRGGIGKVFEDAKLGHLKDSIRKKTEKKYKQIIGTKTVRGTGRKAIVAACLLYTFREEEDIRTADEVGSLFGLTKQEMSTGLTAYHTRFPESRTEIVKPSDLIRRIMHLTKIDISHYRNILRISRCLDGVDATLNRSSPQSVASAIVYLYICLTPSIKKSTGFTKTKFARDVSLSDITITKLVKIAAQVIGQTVEM